MHSVVGCAWYSVVVSGVVVMCVLVTSLRYCLASANMVSMNSVVGVMCIV